MHLSLIKYHKIKNLTTYHNGSNLNKDFQCNKANTVTRKKAYRHAKTHITYEDYPKQGFALNQRMIKNL